MRVVEVSWVWLEMRTRMGVGGGGGGGAEGRLLQAGSFKRIFFFFFKVWGFPGGSVGKESACQCRRPRFDPWVGKIPWRRAWQPTPVFLPAESLGQRSLAGLQSTGLCRVRDDSVTFTFFHFSRGSQVYLSFLPFFPLLSTGFPSPLVV